MDNVDTATVGRGAKPPRPSWMTTGWRDCSDIKTGDRANTPRYFRCYKPGCNRLVTHAQVQMGGCYCGNRKISASIGLTHMEILLMKIGWFPLDDDEKALVRPWANTMWLRDLLYRYLG